MKKSLGAKTIVYPTPVFIVGTYDKDNKPNAMNAAWGGICCSKPPCVTISLRKATHTYGNIMEKKAYTVNIPSENYIKEADYFGIVSGKDIDKFAKTGLTPIKSDIIDAPYIKEFPLILECKVIHVIEIGLHTQFVGEILDVKVDEAMIENDLPNIEEIRPMIYATGIQNYYSIGKNLGKAFSIGKEIQ
ncbi:MAG: flavin reductase family protein [bacterium]